jgi:hypothetical protein
LTELRAQREHVLHLTDEEKEREEGKTQTADGVFACERLPFSERVDHDRGKDGKKERERVFVEKYY